MLCHIGLSEGVRKQQAHALSLVLADTYVLYVKTQNFHWNLIDPRFASLHAFLQTQYEELAEAIDELAERIRMLGERSPGSLKKFLEITSIEEEANDFDGDKILKELLKNHEAIIQYLRGHIKTSNELGDDGTGDLLIQRLRSHEKTAWMLRSHFKN